MSALPELQARKRLVEHLLAEVDQVLHLVAAGATERAEWLSIRTACLDEQRRVRHDMRRRGRPA